MLTCPHCDAQLVETAVKCLYCRNRLDAPVKNVRYQTVWPRLGAALIDGLIFFPIGLICIYVLMKHSHNTWMISFSVFFNSSMLVYSVLMHGRYGQTLGKMLMRVRVLNKNCGPITYSQAALRDCVLILIFCVDLIYAVCNPERYAMYALSDDPARPLFFKISEMAYFIWIILEILTALTNYKRRALHDFIAGTVVYRLPPGKGLRPHPVNLNPRL